jgi:hypothetical protein
MLRRGWVLFVCLFATVTVYGQSNAATTESCGYDMNALQVAVEADGWVFDDLVNFRWSPDCRYVLMREPSRYGEPGTWVLWDAANNVRIGDIEGFISAGTGTEPQWDPNSSYMIVPINNVGTYLWDISENHQMLLTENECGLVKVHWDYEQRLVYGTSPLEYTDNWCSGNVNVDGLRAYSMNTGEVVRQYDDVIRFSISYEVSDDNRFITLSSFSSTDPINIIDRVSGEVISRVDVTEGGQLRPGHNLSQIDLSDNGRYLVIGLRYIRVWDLQNLPADFNDHRPIYRYEGPSEYIREIHFLDNHTVETVTREGVQQWDLTTGEEIR